MNLNKHKPVFFSMLLAGLLLVALFMLLNGTPQTARADPGDKFVMVAGGGDCTQSNPCDLQTALGTASNGETIYIAGGTYTGSGAAVITVTKSIIIYGGWDGASGGAVVRDPQAYPTTLDGESQRRGAYVSGAITVTLEGFTVTNGVSQVEGAGLYANNVHLTLRAMTFYSNVISAITGYPYGGGALVERGTLQVEDSTFRANSVWGGSSSIGGGLVISDTLAATVSDSVFRDNDAWVASGLYFRAPYFSYNPPITIKGSRFIDNGCGNSPGAAIGGYQGAMRIVYANARVDDNLFEHNKFSSGRGAVDVSNSHLLFSRNIISGNISQYGTSGLYLNYLASHFTMTNNLIVNNQSTHYGGVYPCVRISGSDGQMLQNTIARNDNNYGVKIEDGADVTLTNTILVSHTVGISVTAGSSATLEGTLWGSGSWANDTDWGGEGTIVTGMVNIWGDPDFVNPDSGDYQIDLGSAARNAGVNSGVTTDINGNPRPYGSGYDIGAYEYSSPHWDVYIPLVVR